MQVRVQPPSQNRRAAIHNGVDYVQHVATANSEDVPPRPSWQRVIFDQPLGRVMRAVALLVALEPFGEHRLKTRPAGIVLLILGRIAPRVPRLFGFPPCLAGIA